MGLVVMVEPITVISTCLCITVVYITRKRFWGLGPACYVPVAVIIGRHGEEAIATQLGQDYLCLQTSRKDNFEIIHIKEDIYNIIGQKNDIEVLLVSRTSSPIEYTMTELDSDDEGFDDGLVQLTKDNPRLMKLLVEDKYFNEKVRQLGPLLLETLIEGIEAKTTEEVLIIKRVIDCLYDKNTTPSLNKELNL
ncbi:unnamed protein product [Arctia plantaginis]|uniref:Uncharacterized protein n=1 Tax=Arctia plantaginis TaxID=874455 RepID=A0A8S0ZFV9_ARCPL|nr:unnamed protein product [Arctia plantaginis]